VLETFKSLDPYVSADTASRSNLTSINQGINEVKFDFDLTSVVLSLIFHIGKKLSVVSWIKFASCSFFLKFLNLFDDILSLGIVDLVVVLKVNSSLVV
jgi:hypothetical protein